MMMMMIMMKKPVVLVICTLLFSSLTVVVSASTSTPKECCFNMFNKPVPKRNVQDYRWTDEKCSKQAVVLVIPRGDVCADPKEKWVMKIIMEQNMKKRKVTTVTVGPPQVSAK